MRKDGRELTALKKKFYVASVSFGKDSVYMLLYILEHPDKYPLNLVLFVNTGYEFDAVYAVRDQVIEMLKNRDIPYVELDISEQFYYYMFEKPVCKQGTKQVHRHGFGWCGGVCRWGTALKMRALHAYYKEKLAQYDVVEYIGIAADEMERVDVEAQKKGKKIYPLVDGGFTEGQCLMGCYKAGYTWKEGDIYLYELLERLSCWCCRNKNLKELKALYYCLRQKYWSRLKEMQSRIGEPMKGDSGSVFELEKRFRKEGRQVDVFELLSFPEGVE